MSSPTRNSAHNYPYNPDNETSWLYVMINAYCQALQFRVQEVHRKIGLESWTPTCRVPGISRQRACPSDS
jgi:hypothetical protein